MRTTLLALVLCFGCKKDADTKPAPTPPATITTGTVAPDGVRTIAIEAGADGYKPDRIPGKPGEKLNLVFTRTIEESCINELRTPDGVVHKLPMNQPVNVAITVPATGQVEFACSMGMFKGSIVAQPAT